MHDVAPALFLSPAAAIITFLLGSRAVLSVTGRAASPWLAARIGLSPDEPRSTGSGIAFEVGFTALAQVLVLVVLLSNLGRADGTVAVVVPAVEMGLAVLWAAVVFRSSGPVPR